MCVFVWLCGCKHRCQLSPEKGHWVPWELQEVVSCLILDAGTQAQVIHRDSKHSWLLSDPSSPHLSYFCLERLCCQAQW